MKHPRLDDHGKVSHLKSLINKNGYGQLMDRPIAFSLRDVSKKYRLFGSNLARLKEALHPFRKKYHQEFWALQDVNLEVRQGDTLGILGLNGSGKSTLLQIICSILKPTRGMVEVHGRISALLELGVGFNPQLTGQENVELFCILSGLSEKEIADCLPAIEQFADIGQFFEQPVQNYSSGMFIRLAFAAAIHVDPDILVLDEVLAVGDARFQHKCFAKFREFQEQGKTILLVTHNPDTVARHCTRAIVLDQGRIVVDADPNRAISHYYKLVFSSDPVAEPHPSGDFKEGWSLTDQNDIPPELFTLGNVDDRMAERPNYNPGENRFGNGAARILDAVVVSNFRVDAMEVASGDEIDVYVRVLFKIATNEPVYGLNIKTIDGIVIYGTTTVNLGQSITPVRPGDEIVIRMSIPLPLQYGDVFIDLGVGCLENGNLVALDARHSSLHLRIVEKMPFYGLTNLRLKFREMYRGRIRASNPS